MRCGLWKKRVNAFSQKFTLVTRPSVWTAFLFPPKCQGLVSSILTVLYLSVAFVLENFVLYLHTHFSSNSTNNYLHIQHKKRHTLMIFKYGESIIPSNKTLIIFKSVQSTNPLQSITQQHTLISPASTINMPELGSPHDPLKLQML